jgi:signal transduction histidine kinase
VVRTAHPEVTVECDVPDEPPWVHADDMLKRVFDHPLTNVAEHNDASVHVAATVTVDPERVTVTIVDDGDGIPPERLAQLFTAEEFGHPRGWGGFGLSIVHALVREYDGRVWAADNDPSGTVFGVELRRADAPDERRD